MTRLRILFANDRLTERSGAEMVTRDLALGLRRRGHVPVVYAPLLGAVADEMRAAGVPVVRDLDMVADEPDIIHGNHHVETVQALFRFPRAQALFVCHHRWAHIAAPPLVGRVRRYVAVDANCLDRLTLDYRIPEARTRVIYNAVDTDRFRQRRPLPPVPGRAAIFSNYAVPGTHLDAIVAACARLKLPLDVIGSGAGAQTKSPEAVLGTYDLVFAKARCAIEAMAVGAAVVLCDFQGLGPMVTSPPFDELRRWNFGMRLLSEPLDPARVIKEIERYDAADARRVSDAVRARASLSDAIDQYLAVYDEVAADPWDGPAGQELDEFLRTTASRIHELEHELAEFRRPYRMEPLAESACRALSVKILACPRQAQCGERLWLDVQVENRSTRHLGSFVPFPVHLSYRWLGADGRMIVDEGRRTLLRPSLAPGEKATYSCGADAPSVAGRHRLRMTLVQESVGWLDAMKSPVGAEAVVDVADPGIRSSSPA